MSLIPDDKKELLKNDFKAKLVDPIKILMFTQEIECRFCAETKKNSPRNAQPQRQNHY
ncbi:MAG: hypothetical protein NWF01_04755 [Candidatus Bathyarchaeota archaeon]|nr:hypothetical protein [Candidatus Bathyarchaeota archaeon]